MSFLEKTSFLFLSQQWPRFFDWVIGEMQDMNIWEWLVCTECQVLSSGFWLMATLSIRDLQNVLLKPAYLAQVLQIEGRGFLEWVNPSDVGTLSLPVAFDFY